MVEQVVEIEKALAQVDGLPELQPICSYCKRIRNDRNYWQRVEIPLLEHSEAEFTHGICPQCYETVVRPELEQIRDR